MNIDQVNALKKLLFNEKIVKLKTTGNSMLPTIKPNDIVDIVRIRDKIKINDIVVFFDENNNNFDLVAHRVVDIIGGKFIITKGDNNHIVDKPVRIKKVFAKVINITHNSEEMT